MVSLIHQDLEKSFKMFLTIKPISFYDDKSGQSEVVKASYIVFGISLLISLLYTAYSKLSIQKKYKKEMEIGYFEGLK